MSCCLRVVLADITESSCEAIVNAANQEMLGGGGVDGAIHRAAGPELLQACLQVSMVQPGVRCPTGEARLTPGFNLRADYIIHTVGPIYARHPEPALALARAYRACLQLAELNTLRSLAFPAISCGVYGYPLDEAASIAVGVVRERSWELDEVCFTLFSESALKEYNKVLFGY